MRSKIVWLIIAAILSGIGGWALQYVAQIPPPIAAVIAILAFAGMSYAIYKSEIFGVKKDTAINEKTPEIVEIQYKYGRVTAMELLAMARTMFDIHGHEDLIGMQWDLKSGVVPNELMTRPCHKCRTQRNMKYKGKRFII